MLYEIASCMLKINFNTAWIGPVIIIAGAVCLILIAYFKSRRAREKDAKNTEPLDAEAEKLYRKALSGTGEDWYNLYCFSYKHLGDSNLSFDYKRFEEYLQRASDCGYPQAMCELGKEKRFTDRKLGRELLEKAAEQGVDEACLILARQYTNGMYGYFPEGSEKLSKKECAVNSAKWLSIAAGRGNAEAQCSLGHVLRFHLDEEEKALEWFTKAAEQGEGEGYLGAARIYKKRNEFYKAQKNYKEGAERGNTYAQLELAEMLLSGGLFYDKDKAVYWLKKSADGDNVYAIKKLAEFYRDGNVLKQDISKTVYWLKKGAKLGDDTASYDLALRYLNGDGVEKDEKEAIKHLKYSAGKYNADAICELGFCYLNGVGVAKNLQKAEKMFKRAVEEGGDGRAKKALKTYFNG